MNLLFRWHEPLLRRCRMSSLTQFASRYGLVVITLTAWAGWKAPCLADYEDAGEDAPPPQSQIATRTAPAPPQNQGGPSFDGTYSSKSLKLKLRRAGGGNGMSMYLGT